MSRFRPYPAYKDSGVEWLGEVPEHWETKPLFTHLREREVKNTGNREQRVLSLSYGRIIERDVESNFGLLPESFETYQIVEPDNIVMRLTDLQNDQRSLRVGRVRERGIITSAYVCLEAKGNIDSSFAHYLLHCYDLLKVFYGLGGGVRQTMKFEDLKRLPILRPSTEEQALIAAFLDRETAKIDALVAKKERMIELLQEKRTVLITRAVTKGLDPTVPMKDSGVEWMGEIPAHWEVKRLKFLFKNLDYKRVPLSGEERSYMEKNYPYYGASGVIDTVENYLFDEPLLLVAEDGANLLSRSTPLAFIAEDKYWVNNHAHILKPKDGFLKYWEGLLQTFDYTPLISGAAQPKLTAEILGEIALPSPSTMELGEIIAFLEKETSKLDALTNKIREAIDRLKKYRTALISAAVTGKIDVRDM